MITDVFSIFIADNGDLYVPTYIDDQIGLVVKEHDQSDFEAAADVSYLNSLIKEGQQMSSTSARLTEGSYILAWVKEEIGRDDIFGKILDDSFEEEIGEFSINTYFSNK